MLNRTLVYVDTSYLLASFYNSWEIGARAQLEIDLPEVVSVLGTMITDQIKQPVHRQYWYDGIPEGGPHRYQRALRSEPLVQLRAGQLIEWGDRRTQKAVDTRLVADMVIAATKAQFSDIVLVSGDADMLPGVEEAINAGMRVHLYGFGWDSMSSQLRFVCDTTTILDPREDFKDTMRLNVLEGPLTATTGDTPAEPDTKPLADAEPIEHEGPCPIPDSVTRTSSSEVAAAETPAANTEASTAAQEVTKQSEPVTDTTDDTVTAPPRHPRPVVAGADAANLASSSTNDSAPDVQSTASPAGSQAVAFANAASQSAQPSHPIPQASPQQIDTAAKKNAAQTQQAPEEASADAPEKPKPNRPNPGMMARHRKLRSQYVPLPDEVWASAGEQSPFDVGQQYAIWWYDHAANEEQKDNAHLLTGGGLPPEIDRPLLQFACDTLSVYTLSESQRVGLRDGFHSGIRGVMLRH